IAGVTNFDHRVMAHFALEADIPALDVGHLQIRVVAVQAVRQSRSERILWRIRNSGTRRQTGVAEQHAPRSTEICWIAGRTDRSIVIQSLVGAEEALERVAAIAHRGKGVAGTYDRFALIVSGKNAQRPVCAGQTPGKADRRVPHIRSLIVAAV